MLYLDLFAHYSLFINPFANRTNTDPTAPKSSRIRVCAFCTKYYCRKTLDRNGTIGTVLTLELIAYCK